MANVVLKSIKFPGLTDTYVIPYGATAQMIAPDYGSLTFPVKTGTPCTRDGVLYMAIQDIATSEEWTAAHWRETNAAEMCDLASSMEKIAVSGSTPSITAESNKLYICGEVSTLSITPPASGICGVIFESGSTATVLTLGSGITCPEWFDDENLEADTIYELNINEGLLSVGMWGAS